MSTNPRVQFLLFFLVVILVGGVAFSGGVIVDRVALQPDGLLAPLLGIPPAPASTDTGGVTSLTPSAATSTTTITVPSSTAADFQRLVEAYNTIQKNYVDRQAIQITPLINGAIGGMVEALGDTGHSRFLDPQMLKQETSSLNGSFEGIGAYVDNKDGHTVIVAPIDGSPAQAAGILPGDIILKVDGADVSGLSLQAVIGKIVGPAGTQVELTLQNPTDHKLRTLTITRARIVIQNVTWNMVPGTTIADVHIVQFAQGVTQQLKDALNAAKAQGATSLVLDLRNNPGGILNEAVGVASQFLQSGVVLQQKDAQGNIRTNPVQRGGVAISLPMVVLINGGSASASEIVAGALQDAGRASLVGATTFGTGTVLSTFPQPGDSALLLATEEWLTPKGRSIWHEGITPDQAVDLDPAVTLLSPSQLKTMTADQLQASPDAQFLEALKLVK